MLHCTICGLPIFEPTTEGDDDAGDDSVSLKGSIDGGEIQPLHLHILCIIGHSITWPNGKRLY